MKAKTFQLPEYTISLQKAHNVLTGEPIQVTVNKAILAYLENFSKKKNKK